MTPDHDEVLIAWCAAANQADALRDTTDVFDPEQFEATVTEILVLSEVRAPGEIAPDFEMQRMSMRIAADIFAANDWDPIAGSAEMEAHPNEAAFTEASDAVNAFQAARCGGAS